MKLGPAFSRNLGGPSEMFAFAKPAREILYTVVSPEERYKPKTILDTVVYRGGDVAVGWFYSMLSGIGFAMAQIV